MESIVKMSTEILNENYTLVNFDTIIKLEGNTEAVHVALESITCRNQELSNNSRFINTKVVTC